jgi:hypothetical protein
MKAFRVLIVAALVSVAVLAPVLLYTLAVWRMSEVFARIESGASLFLLALCAVLFACAAMIASAIHWAIERHAAAQRSAAKAAAYQQTLACLTERDIAAAAIYVSLHAGPAVVQQFDTTVKSCLDQPYADEQITAAILQLAAAMRTDLGEKTAISKEQLSAWLPCKDASVPA